MEVEEGEDEEDDDDVEHLFPPPIMQLGDSGRKRSSGRATVPSSRPQGYELY